MMGTIDSPIEIGVVDADPYAWLEDADSPRTRDWTGEQTRLAHAYFGAHHTPPGLIDRITAHLATSGLLAPRRFGRWWFLQWHEPGEDRPSIARTRSLLRGGVERLLQPPADGDCSYDVMDVSPDGRWLAYSVRRGSDTCKAVEFFDLRTRTRARDRLEEGFMRGLAFDRTSTAVYYVREDPIDREAPRTLRRHVLGTDARRDEVVHDAGRDPATRLVAAFVRHRRYALYTVLRAGTPCRCDYYLHDLARRTPPQLVATGVTDHVDFRAHGDWWYICTDRGAPNRLIGRTPFRSPNLEALEPIVSEQDTRIGQWQVLGDRIVVSDVHDLRARLRVFDLHGRPHGDIPLPEPGTVNLAPLESSSEVVWFDFESFTQPPTLYRYSLRTRSLHAVHQSGKPLACAVEIRRHWARSKDGTAVPVTLVGQPRAFAEGRRPLLMTGYGASAKSMTPQLSVLGSLLIEDGGLFAVAAVRGGGEFGAAWHQAAAGRRRQCAVDDFIACAESLIEAGLTSANQLAIAGASNGGTLVGAALTQRPDLFRAVLCLMTILDLLCFQRTAVGQFMISTLADPANPDDATVLRALSPYHQVREGTRYPAVYLLAGGLDRRCDPMHGRKMAAQLQAATAGSHPILLDWDALRGHSRGLSLEHRVRALARRATFLWHELGVIRADESVREVLPAAGLTR